MKSSISRTLILSFSLGSAIMVLPSPGADEMKPPQANPQMQAVLDTLTSLDPKPIQQCTASQARSQPSAADAVKALLTKKGMSTDPEPVGDVSNKKISDQNGSIPIRVYTPKGDGPFPVLVYYHGGGFVIATVDTYDSSCRALCNGANCVVVSVEYRKAPENKFPAAPDDAWAAWTWVTQNAASIHGDSKHLAVGGESAGGNLATETALTAASKGGPTPEFELLIYPVAGNKLDTPSYVRNTDAKPLSKAMMRWFFDQYLPTPASGDDPRATPMLASDAEVAKLPPTMIVTAEIDPLHDDGEMYAKKLKSAGVQVEYKNYEGVTHEFFGMGAVVDTAKQAENDASSALKAALEK